MKKIVIFGATGNIGIYLTDYLHEKYMSQYEIIAVGHRKTNYFDKLNVRYYSMDIRDKDAFSQLPQDDVFAAVHLANMLPARMTDDNPYTHFDINLLGTLNILEYLRKTGADRIVFTQTYADIAGHWNKQVELMPDLPRSLVYTGDHALYAISKCAAVDTMEYYHQTFGLKNYILRLPNIYMYAPEKYYYVNGEKRLISYRYLIERAINGEPIELWGDPSRLRDIVYVKDFCQLVSCCISATNDGGIYNVGTGKGTTMQQQVEGIIRVFSADNRRSEIIYCPEKKNAMEYVMNIDNAKKDLGYDPQYSYEDYLSDYKIEMKSNRFEGL